MAGDWQDRIGRTEQAEDSIDPRLVARYSAMLDRPGAEVIVPQGLHWCLALPADSAARLGADGHAVRDATTLLPPVPLPRRMWAASSVAFIRPLGVGDAVRRTSRLASVRSKSGASGALVFVEVAHEFDTAGQVAIRETQTIVYREAGTPTAMVAAHPGFDFADALAHRIVRSDPVLLFRYSALTFNSHRIHYDLPYARNEGYPGLVVQGPLIATLLLDLARDALGDQPFATFAFRAVSPAIAGDALHLALWAKDDGYRLGAYADDGREIMAASATPPR